jgi:histidine phosphotransferase ChpT
MNIDHKIPTRASEILISKICHDLVSPVGAVNNGIEFLSEMGAEGLQDGLGLIEHSARQSSVRLQLFRMCYGAGGSDAKVTGKTIYETFLNYIEGTKCSMEWDLMNAVPDDDPEAGFMKTLLNCMVFVQESMPKGGVVSVTMDGGAMVITGKASLIRPKEGSMEALKGKLSVDELTPKAIHGFITNAYADLFGFKVSVTMSESEIVLVLK